MNQPLPFKRAFLCALLATQLFQSENAWALDPATRGAARDLAYAGVEAFQNEEFEQASEKLERAYALLQAPSVALWSARALERCGKWVEASERYLEASRLSPESGSDHEVQLQAVEDAKREREALRPKIPTLVIEVEGAEPENTQITINGVAVAAALFGARRPTNPGDVRVRGVHNEEEVKEEFVLTPGEERVLRLSFTPPRPEAPPPPAPESQEEPVSAAEAPPEAPLSPEAVQHSPQRTAGWISLGVGGAGLLFGAVTGLVAIDQNNKLKSECPGGVCPNDEGDALKNYNTMKTLSSIGLIGGGILAATGISLLIFTPQEPNAAYVAPYIGLGDLGLRGRF